MLQSKLNSIGLFPENWILLCKLTVNSTFCTNIECAYLRSPKKMISMSRSISSIKEYGTIQYQTDVLILCKSSHKLLLRICVKSTIDSFIYRNHYVCSSSVCFSNRSIICINNNECIYWTKSIHQTLQSTKGQQNFQLQTTERSVWNCVSLQWTHLRHSTKAFVHIWNKFVNGEKKTWSRIMGKSYVTLATSSS